MKERKIIKKCSEGTPMIARIGYVVSISLIIYSSAAQAQQASHALPEYVSNQVIVAFEPGAAASAIAEAHRQAAASPIRRLGAIGAVVVNTNNRSVPATVALYQSNPNVRYAEPNYLRLMIIPNEGSDPNPPNGLGIDYFPEQYGLHSTGQSIYYDEWTGAPGAITTVTDADVDAPEAWDLHTGSPLTTVAILDSGVQCSHPDLVGKCVDPSINLGPSDTADDVLGHGTLVASVVGANSNNGIGIAGVSWGTSIASVKVCYEAYDIFFGLVGLCDSAASAAGMIHAADQGYQVVNMSYAGPDISQAEAAAVTYAWDNGVVLVAAAANNYSQIPMYPASFENVIGVAATDWFGNLAGFSNFGPAVSMSAPGAKMFVAFPQESCPVIDPEGCYGWADGTSFSSPMVAGAAALVSSYIGPSATHTQVRNALQSGAATNGPLGQNMLAWSQFGSLNLLGALQAADGATPLPSGSPGIHVSDLDASAVSSGSNWTAHVSVNVVDENHAVVDNGTVMGQWSYGGMGQCTISASQCQVVSSPVAKNTRVVNFSVISITVSGSDYQPADNHDPDSDSDGTTIAVSR
jgi:thermitase